MEKEMGKQVWAMTDGELDKEWHRLGCLPITVITKVQRDRFAAIDAEGFRRKYDGGAVLLDSESEASQKEQP